MYQMAIDYCDGKGYQLRGKPTTNKEALEIEVRIYNMGSDYSIAKIVNV